MTSHGRPAERGHAGQGGAGRGRAAGKPAAGSVAAGEVARYWRHGAVPGVDLLRARFVTHRYARHMHETYTLALIEDGVEEFRYGGTLLRAGRGAVALLNPEMVHTGQAGIPGGWSYRVLYPAVSVVREVSAELTGLGHAVLPGHGGGRPARRPAGPGRPPGRRTWRPAGLRQPAARGAGLAAARARPGCAVGRSRESRLAVRAAVSLLHERLTASHAGGTGPGHRGGAVRADARLPGGDRGCRRTRTSTSSGSGRPWALLDRGVPPAEAAAEAGFADQAHLTRHFKRVVGVPPGAYQRARRDGAHLVAVAPGGTRPAQPAGPS